MPISPYLRQLRERVGPELLLVPSVTAVIYDEHGRILLARHAESDVWVAPGGSVDPHESPADAVVRETWEETGLSVRPAALLGVYGGREFLVTYANGDRVAYLMTVFECGIVEGTARPDGVETLELRWVSEADIAGLRLPVWAHVVLADAFHGRGRTHFRAPSWRPPAGQAGAT